MSFIKPETKDALSSERDYDLDLFNCKICFSQTIRKDMSTYGARCWKCYDDYCRQVPPIDPSLLTHKSDPLGWAKRIIDKHNSGKPVSKIGLEMAKQVLKIDL